jgi:uncharacterized protein with HEPN domain
MRDDRLYLIHISECIQRIEQYTADGEDAFLADIKTQDAVLRNLHTLSESTQRLSDDLKGRYPAIDWRSIAGFRNVIVHDYLGVDMKQVWDIVAEDLPNLKLAIATIRHETER